ncbi:uncharacterized protein LOC118187843 [Stegodyphus dumicola]|uniref:uncharacterized protein LOC118187843 n=1 Tax=Stegodyphus dumicola TaxID=202533 RepID=UPI0015A9307B|nr:uncharacterized protein LOC118187843 [Stegodyphus dumicola]XP_035214025.1 uncharacterized protein LOC118187843 [Stegodyphus dumicola]
MLQVEVTYQANKDISLEADSSAIFDFDCMSTDKGIQDFGYAEVSCNNHCGVTAAPDLFSKSMESSTDFTDALLDLELSADLNFLSSMDFCLDEQVCVLSGTSESTVDTCISTENNISDFQVASPNLKSPDQNHIPTLMPDFNSVSLNVCEEETASKSETSDFQCVASKKYVEMRRKNNIASQRSRKLRKLKNLEMTEKVKKLEAENKELSILAQKLEKQRDVLQKLLLETIAKR